MSIDTTYDDLNSDDYLDNGDIDNLSSYFRSLNKPAEDVDDEEDEPASRQDMIDFLHRVGMSTSALSNEEIEREFELIMDGNDKCEFGDPGEMEF